MLTYAPAVARRPHVAMLECDIADGLTPLPAVDELGDPFSAIELLVRVFGEPIGIVRFAPGPAGIDVPELARAIMVRFPMAVAERIRSAGVPWDGRLPVDGLDPVVVPPFVAAREHALLRAPSVTVAICTRDRPERLIRLLNSLELQRYHRMQVVVVDNARTDDSVLQVVDRYRSRLDILYAEEPRPGLSWARNRAIEVSDGEIIAWVDDDGICDPWWVSEIARGFVEHPEAGAVTGIVLAAEIETPAQLRFEQYGGHSKGRGFAPEVFSPATRAVQSPLYPLPAFGVGGNMAFRREALASIGGFDRALGAGTFSEGAEDTAALSTLLYLGGTVLYRPSAIVRHRHRRDDGAPRDGLVSYGTGLGAFYTSILLHHPRAIFELARLAPRALRDLKSRDGARVGGLATDFPEGLLKANRTGLLRGPWRYLRARGAARRLGRRVVPA